MKCFVGVTDGGWYRFLSRRPDLEEVNFWQPSGSTVFKALNRGVSGVEEAYKRTENLWS